MTMNDVLKKEIGIGGQKKVAHSKTGHSLEVIKQELFGY